MQQVLKPLGSYMRLFTVSPGARSRTELYLMANDQRTAFKIWFSFARNRTGEDRKREKCPWKMKTHSRSKRSILKLINNSSSVNKENHDHEYVI